MWVRCWVGFKFQWGPGGQFFLFCEVFGRFPFYISTSVNYLTINRQFGHEANGNYNGAGDVCKWTSFLKELMMRVLKA
jgi:hypothetical protein